MKSKKAVKVESKERYFEGVGRRKTAVARVRIVKGDPKGAPSGRGEFLVNGRPLQKYFPLKKHEETVLAPFNKLSLKGYKASVKVSGGGVSAQAEAVRLGLARALTLLDASFRAQLKAFGYLTRDPRMVERKKYGLRKARRPQQWRKR